MDLVNATHEANQTFIAYLKTQKPNAVLSQSPEGVDTWQLGTHPDLVDHLWDDIPKSLPVSCKWIVYGRPALVHPDNGVIFGLAGGTSTLALRLPTVERDEAFKVEKYGAEYKYPSETIYAKNFGDDWALVPPFDKRLTNWCLKAYEYAGTL
jgi:hypothetical protein